MTLIDFSPEVFPEYNVTTPEKVSWKYDCSFITSLENYMKVFYWSNIGKLCSDPIETLLTVRGFPGNNNYCEAGSVWVRGCAGLVWWDEMWWTNRELFTVCNIWSVWRDAGLVRPDVPSVAEGTKMFSKRRW